MRDRACEAEGHLHRFARAREFQATARLVDVPRGILQHGQSRTAYVVDRFKVQQQPLAGDSRLPDRGAQIAGAGTANPASHNKGCLSRRSIDRNVKTPGVRMGGRG